VLLTTHLMDEAEELADELVIIDHGRIVASGTPSEVTRTGAEGLLSLVAPPGLDLAPLHAVLPADFQAQEVSPGDYVVRGAIDPHVVAAVTSWCAGQDALATELRVDQRRLEDVFLELTGRDLRG